MTANILSFVVTDDPVICGRCGKHPAHFDTLTENKQYLCGVCAGSKVPVEIRITKAQYQRLLEQEANG